MPKRRETCPVAGCGKATNGKQYCNEHINVSTRRKMPIAVKLLARSLCCEVKCVSGKAHENGEQYCTKCKEPCLWKA